MNPHHPSADEIFERASQLSGEARAAYLKEATCADDQLRQRIENLLQANESAGTAFLNQPAVVSAKTLVITSGVAPVTEKPGDKIGRYKLREQIGEGGCGVVYVAEQEEPVRRRVALKVIKLGMDTRQVVARFEAERQALALMDHPNIAKVLDAGATDTGRPYFVMELVRGIKITDYCDKNNLSTEERLKLFIQVCSAIQHAHQKGIIHRDIKPSNILVTLHDGVPVPKVIDFGIAKATSDQRLTDKTIYTAFEQFIGTPAYMSPEQAEMSGLDIDTRSDIYSLGVLLYELLTGQTPFDATALLQAGLDQMRRIIREQEPPRPSTRLSTLEHADLTVVAGHRHVEPPRLEHLIRGDLDWIVMKALEKDRTRRYETVNAFAVDVKRHLDDETVVARPPSFFYRLQKIVQRNKAAFAISTGIVLIIIAGLGVSFHLMHKEKSALERALSAEIAQRRSAQEAEANELIYEAAAVLSQLANDELKLEIVSKLPKVESQLRKVVAIRTELFGRKDPRVLDALKKLCDTLTYSVKFRSDTAGLLREVVEIEKETKGKDHPDVADSLDLLANYLDQGNANLKADAEAAYREALAIRRIHFDKKYTNLDQTMFSLARVLREHGKLAEAESLYREIFAMRGFDNIGGYVGLAFDLFKLLMEEGKLADAEKFCRDWNEWIAQSKNTDDDTRLLGLYNLAFVLRVRGELDASISIENQALTAAKEIVARAGLNRDWPISNLADRCGEWHRPAETEWVFDGLLSLTLSKDVKATLLVQRAGLRAALKRFKEAEGDLAMAANLRPDYNLDDLARRLILLSELGDVARRNECFEKIPVGELEMPGPELLSPIAHVPLLIPPSKTDLPNAVLMADNLFKSFKDYDGYLFCYISRDDGATHRGRENWFCDTTDAARLHAIKSLAEYRRGNFREALAFANKAQFYDQHPMSYVVLAMAQHQLGEFNEAKASFTKAAELLRTIWKQSWDEDAAQFFWDTTNFRTLPKQSWQSWEEELSVQILLREARSLIENKPATPEPAK